MCGEGFGGNRELRMLLRAHGGVFVAEWVAVRASTDVAEDPEDSVSRARSKGDLGEIGVRGSFSPTASTDILSRGPMGSEPEPELEGGGISIVSDGTKVAAALESELFRATTWAKVGI